jgi:hypothetical protein
MLAFLVGICGIFLKLFDVAIFFWFLGDKILFLNNFPWIYFKKNNFITHFAENTCVFRDELVEKFWLGYRKILGRFVPLK